MVTHCERIFPVSDADFKIVLSASNTSREFKFILDHILTLEEDLTKSDLDACGFGMVLSWSYIVIT